MSKPRLTDEDMRILNHIDRSEQDLVLARDVARALGLSPRVGGPKMRRLVKMGLCNEQFRPSDRMYGYKLSVVGRDLVGE